ncbi:Ku protein [Acetobacteraceae bacterium AT-5844]|nr:Ku protein [Acetobacteraceae bacterium AT-5844]
MSDRPIWRGTLRLALVSCRIALLPARQERNNLHFHLINPKTGNRIRTRTVDAETGREVERSALVRGFEFEKGQYVLLTDEDFESARVESSNTLAIAKFVKAGSISPLYFENSYYLVPQEDEALDVYAVLRDALRKSGMMALSRLVLFRRERPVAILPLEQGMVLHTLQEEGDLRDAQEAFADVPKASPDAEMVKLAQQLIARQAGTYDPADTEDRYEARLREVIEDRRQGKTITVEPEEEPSERGNVVDLMAALRASLKKSSGASSSKHESKVAKKPSAKRTPAKRKRA